MKVAKIHDFCKPLRAGLAAKILLVMRLTAFLLLAACLGVQAHGYSQKKLTLSEKDAPLPKIFQAIEQQSEYHFFYDYPLLQRAAKVSLNVKDASLDQVLDLCFKDQPFSYSVVGSLIVVKAKDQSRSEEDSKPQIKVDAQGVVYNESGQPLSGANVTLKETGRGTITNALGEFAYPGIPVGATLTISYTGYAPQNIKIKDATKMRIYLNIARSELDKVVVQAYGTTTERLTTGNITTVTSEQIERQPVMNAIAALQGQVPGVVVSQTSGYASAPFKVEIRGRSVINSNLTSDPLYIVDGVPLTVINLGNGGNYATGSTGISQNGFPGPAGGQSPFFSINPGDIESITVLKDADATSIYGSRGANGVIIITTKKGKPGKAKLDISAYQGENRVTNHYNLLNTQQYLQMRRQAFKNDNIAPTVSNGYDLLQWDTTRYTDWQKVLWGGIGKNTDLQIGLSGGDKQTTFRISGSYHKQTDIMTVSGSDQRASVQFNLTHKSLNQRLSTSLTSLYAYTASNLISLPGGVTLAPDAPAIYNNQGHLNFAGWGGVNSAAANQFSFGALLQPYTATTGLLNSQLNIRYELVRGLSLSTNLGYSTYHQSQSKLTPISSQNPAFNPTGTSNFGNNNGVNAIFEPQLEYKKVIGKGNLGFLLGGSIESVSEDGNTIQGSGYTNDNLLRSVANAPTTQGFNNSGAYKYAALFSRLNYNWENKYILNISARRDGSSRFGPGKQYGNFGSVGAAWIFTEENWLKNKLSVLSFGKLRGSYGTTGSDQIPSYQYLSQWSAAGLIPYQPGVASYVSTILPNPNLVWQSNHKLEIALDLGFFKDRLNLELARYQDRCGNQLVPYVLPILTGFTNVIANYPALVQNTGWETKLNGKIIDQSKFSLSAYVNIGINRNKLIAYPNLAQSPYSGVLFIGQSLSMVRKLHYTGIDPQTGQYSFFDKNHNGTINAYYQNGSTINDDLYDKDLSVKFDGGFGTDLRYKEWQMNLFFQFRKQELPSANYGSIPGTIGNQSVEVLDHWKKPGDVARYARYSTTGAASDSYFINYSDGIYSNGSYIRLKSLSLSYDMPGEWMAKIGITGWRIYVRAENLFLLSKYNGVDPDTPGLGILPPQKTIIGGLQLTL